MFTILREIVSFAEIIFDSKGREVLKTLNDK